MFCPLNCRRFGNKQAFIYIVLVCFCKACRRPESPPPTVSPRWSFSSLSPLYLRPGPERSLPLCSSPQLFPVPGVDSRFPSQKTHIIDAQRAHVTFVVVGSGGPGPSNGCGVGGTGRAGRRSEVLGRGSRRAEAGGSRIAHWLLRGRSLSLTQGGLLSRLAPTLALPAGPGLPPLRKLPCRIVFPVTFPPQRASPPAPGNPCPSQWETSSLLLLSSVGRGRRGHTRPPALSPLWQGEGEVGS